MSAAKKCSLDEFWINDTLLFLYRVKRVDLSFDHPFGVHRDEDVEIEVESVIAYIDDFDVDITCCAQKSSLFDYWVEKIYEHERELLSEFRQQR